MARGVATAAAIGVGVAACAAPTKPTTASFEGGRLLNPKLPDGTPVMMGYDSHHPDCFTFPDGDGESDKVDCPEGVTKILHDCRGSKLFARTGDRAGTCVCVPVSGEEPQELECPETIETE